MRLNECPLPRRLRSWHYVDYFPDDRREWAYGRLLGSLKLRAKNVGVDVETLLKANDDENIKDNKGIVSVPVVGRLYSASPISQLQSSSDVQKVENDVHEEVEQANGDSQDEEEVTSVTYKARQEKALREILESERKDRLTALRKERQWQILENIEGFLTGKVAFIVLGLVLIVIVIYGLFGMIANFEVPIKSETTNTTSPTSPVLATQTAVAVSTDIAAISTISVALTHVAELAQTPTLEMPFDIEAQNISSTIIHSDTGCDWHGVGGTVEDVDGNPLLGVIVRLQGTLDKKLIDMYSISGVSPAYGKSGFEFDLGESTPLASDMMYVYILDQNAIPLSESIRFDTSFTCEQNFLLIHFRQVR